MTPAPMTFDTAQICLNGHVRNDRVVEFPQMGEDHCSICGAKTITACPTCDAPIRGSLKMYPYATGQIPYVRPSFCRGCGEPFPWTTAALAAARALADESEGLTDEEKVLLKDSLPDLVWDTPKGQALMLL